MSFVHDHEDLMNPYTSKYGLPFFGIRHGPSFFVHPVCLFPFLRPFLLQRRRDVFAVKPDRQPYRPVDPSQGFFHDRQRQLVLRRVLKPYRLVSRDRSLRRFRLQEVHSRPGLAARSLYVFDHVQVDFLHLRPPSFVRRISDTAGP